MSLKMKNWFSWKQKMPSCKAMSGCSIGKRTAGVFSCIVLMLGFISLFSWHLNDAAFGETQTVGSEATRLMSGLDDTLDYGSRTGVPTRTSWNAPVIWELMFNANLYDKKHKELNSTVAVTVFAVGRYLEAYLGIFLTSAEKHFMLGLPVTYYVFTDLPEKVPDVALAPQRNIKVVQVEKHSRWQDISMMRMKTISEVIEQELQNRFSYVFCFDVDQEFKGRFGSEALGESVAMVHAHFYKLPKDTFTYDRNPKSKAFMDEGDYYYHAAVFGGTCEKVKALADFCYLNIMADKQNEVEALWHDESHLNKYFWLYKPTKLLSPEYCWDLIIPDTSDILIKRLLWAPKEYEKVRETM